MYELLFWGYEFLVSFLPFYVVFRILRKPRRSIFWEERFLPVLFAVYVIAVFHVTGAGTLYDALNWRFRGLSERVNLIPFSREIDPVGYGLNVVMFLPFGLLVPRIWRKMDSLLPVTLAGFCFSALIEMSQLLSIRGTDVDDLILNTLGAALGYFLHRVWCKIRGVGYRSRNTSLTELPIYLLAMYLGRCLLFHYRGLINLVYGF